MAVNLEETEARVMEEDPRTLDEAKVSIRGRLGILIDRTFVAGLPLS